MYRTRFVFIFFAIATMVLAGSCHVFAASQTWVSSTGSPSNPCTRALPCATFAQALKVTDAGGVIGVIDPGDFGPAVTISRSVTIDGGGVLAGLQSSATGTAAITVSAGLNDTVILRGLHIDGAGTGETGVEFTSGGFLYVEKCTISNFTTYGIDFEPNSASQLFVTDTNIDNANAATTSVGIYLASSATGTGKGSKVTIDNTRITGFSDALHVSSKIRSMVSHSVMSGSTRRGIVVDGNSVVGTEQCILANNTGAGILVNAAGAEVLISNDQIINNGAGLSYGPSGGRIYAIGNTNGAFEDNGQSGTPTAVVPRI